MVSCKNLLYLSLSVGLISCSGYKFKKSETIDQKMMRYQSRETSTSTPDISVFEHSFQGRSIASSNESTPLEGHSNKRVYFLTLLSQYNTMKSFTRSDAPDIGICPNFHTSLINNSFQLKVSQRKNFEKPSFDHRNLNTDQLNDKEYLALYPELHLPLSHSGAHPNVADALMQKNNTLAINQLMDKAYQIHLETTYQELVQLCQDGQSNNYYIFENLITYVKSHPQFSKSTESMKSLMKTTVFSNMAVIQSMEIGEKIRSKGRSLASTPAQYSIFEQEIFNRLDVNWAQDYFRQLQHKRNTTKY